MVRTIRLLSPMVVIAAAQFASGQQLEESVVGKWRLDVEATSKLSSESATVAKLLDALNVSIEFKRDGSLVFKFDSADANARERKGKWKPAKIDEARGSITIDVSLPRAEKLAIIATKERLLVKSGPDKLELVFKRAKE